MKLSLNKKQWHRLLELFVLFSAEAVSRENEGLYIAVEPYLDRISDALDDRDIRETDEAVSDFVIEFVDLDHEDLRDSVIMEFYSETTSMRGNAMCRQIRALRTTCSKLGYIPPKAKAVAELLELTTEEIVMEVRGPSEYDDQDLGDLPDLTSANFTIGGKPTYLLNNIVPIIPAGASPEYIECYNTFIATAGIVEHVRVPTDATHYLNPNAIKLIGLLMKNTA